MENKLDLTKILTESRNENTMDIDEISTLAMLKKINDEDKKVAFAVERALPKVAEAVDEIAQSFQKGGRLIYLGAGTSGRLGILDASECPPTYGVSDEMVQGIIAGGTTAIFKAIEGAEDSLILAKEQLTEKGIKKEDVIVGLAASGRTPYVVAGLKFAQSIGCKTVGIACTPASELSTVSDIMIELLTGAESVTGSTRMKAGTAQKMVLNMLSTGAMIKIGKVYGNLMIDVQATNEKLVERAKRIVMQVANVGEKEAKEALKSAGQSVKLAVVMLLTKLKQEEAKSLLNDCNGSVKEAIKKNLD